MSLPKWIDDSDTPLEIREAFAIAWEALEHLKDIRYESRVKDFCEESDYPAKVALNKIKEMGE